MDIVTMNAAANLAIKKLFANGVIGGEENATIINDSGGEVTDFGGLFGGITYVKVLDEPISLANVNKVEWYVNILGEAVSTETKDTLSVAAEGNLLEMLSVEVRTGNTNTDTFFLAVSVRTDFEEEGVSFVKGLYVLDAVQDDGLGYKVLSIDYTKAISKIDPKYLPVEKINLADYGIDLATIVMSGVKKTVIEGTGKAFFNAINCGKRLECVGVFGTSTLEAIPSLYAGDADGMGAISFALATVYGSSIIKADIIIQCQFLDGVLTENIYVFCDTTMTDLT